MRVTEDWEDIFPWLYMLKGKWNRHAIGYVQVSRKLLHLLFSEELYINGTMEAVKKGDEVVMFAPHFRSVQHSGKLSTTLPHLYIFPL